MKNISKIWVNIMITFFLKFNVVKIEVFIIWICLLTFKFTNTSYLILHDQCFKATRTRRRWILPEASESLVSVTLSIIK